MIGLVIPLRATADDEAVGLDISNHGEEAYVHGEASSTIEFSRRRGETRSGPAIGARMKLIKAIIRPNKVDDLKEAFAKIQIAGMTVTEVRGHGRQKGHTAVYRGREYEVTLLPKMQVETVVPDELVEPALQAIREAAHTGEIGDGRVFICPVEQAYQHPDGGKRFGVRLKVESREVRSKK